VVGLVVVVKSKSNVAAINLSDRRQRTSARLRPWRRHEKRPVPVCVRPSASGWTRGVDELCGHVTAASVLSDTRDEPACLTNIELQSFTK